MKQKLVAAIIMGFISTGIISFALICFNVGFVENFFFRWVKSWMVAYMIVIPLILLVGPKITSFVGYLFRKR